ncbi:hypothetical protein [Leptolyngbya sp. FACHB-261]|uniref:hypothetical protein n=1 Tax=Leptolyngbya sp. FACHB-261 TaxID=2692806 RepID=UPI001683551C|nr:hypothetical protein [Leptolyngbya sp. FACHB-261]MBD2102057.1 hypothetical protein [Leptolyngbya sp. FACHB-261]
MSNLPMFTPNGHTLTPDAYKPPPNTYKFPPKDYNARSCRYSSGVVQPAFSHSAPTYSA